MKDTPMYDLNASKSRFMPGRSQPHVMTLFARAAIVVALLTSGCRGAETTNCRAQHPASNACRSGRTFVVVRHAEKASAEKDPALSERGRTRANALATLLGHAGVTQLLATQYRRTQETLAPLAAKSALHVEVRQADKTLDLVAELRNSPDGSFIVVATHSNVLPLIVEELSGVTLRGVEDHALPEDDFARVIVMTEPCGATRPSVVELSSDGP
ncbi:MAG TPA: histidine phosphatase family protein [Labilithrix sp.]|nr:histidine phosphatase family protein [Labilithrix sp.]